MYNNNSQRKGGYEFERGGGTWEELEKGDFRGIGGEKTRKRKKCIYIVIKFLNY